MKINTVFVKIIRTFYMLNSNDQDLYARSISVVKFKMFKYRTIQS